MTDENRTSRRSFLGQAAASALALGIPAQLLACTNADGKIDADSAEPLLVADKLDRIGLQLYTVRDLMKANVEDTLAKVAGIGYKEVEFAGYFDRTPTALRATLDTLGLTSPASHIGYDAIDPAKIGATLDAANAIGNKYIIVAYLLDTQRKTLDDWKRHAERFNRAGEAAKARGLQFAYHNHDFEFVPLDGKVPYDVLLESSDPSLVKMEMDLYWITKAGSDWKAYFDRWPGRFPMVHVKDSAGAPQHEMRDVGAGSMPFATIFAQRKKGGIEHFFVEHDNPKDPIASITASYQHLKNLSF
ncbi:MAG: sugar phosphate isomerase/epimerase family protein [Gemmatimonadaceae bacterium]